MLTVADGAGEQLVLPRRLFARLVAGTGALRWHAGLRADESWRASVAAGWDAAKRLARREDADVEVAVQGAGELRGGSSGLPASLLFLAALLDVPLPPHFATGTVEAGGMLAGGAAVAAKASRAAGFLAQLGAPGGAFLSPPLLRAPRVEGVTLLEATDVGSAFARLVPSAYGAIAAMHGEARRQPPEVDGETGPFAVVDGATDGSAPRVPGVRVATRGPARARPALWLGDGGRLLWRVEVDDASPTAETILPLLALARRCAATPALHDG